MGIKVKILGLAFLLAAIPYLGDQAIASTFSAGQTVQVTGTGSCLRLHQSPTTSSGVIDCFPDGTLLTVQQISSAYPLSSQPVQSDGYSWWSVQAHGVADSSGVIQNAQGWAASQFLQAASSQQPSSPSSDLGSTFFKGEAVQTATDSNIRNSPAGTVVASVPGGTRMNITGGPQNAALGTVTYAWWQVDYACGAAQCWVAGSQLQATQAAPTSQTITPPAGSSQVTKTAPQTATVNWSAANLTGSYTISCKVDGGATQCPSGFPLTSFDSNGNALFATQGSGELEFDMTAGGAQQSSAFVWVGNNQPPQQQPQQTLGGTTQQLLGGSANCSPSTLLPCFNEWNLQAINPPLPTCSFTANP
ncbi:hypothetical protein M1295_01585, partial [Patescibacteria group bacterium]|nr:hypothetical protein [Patescibacteria group bacterium]